MTLTITDKIMRSDQTAHTARLCHFEAGDAWQVSWLPHRLMDRNAAITAMTLAELVSEGEGIGLHDDPRWPGYRLMGPTTVLRWGSLAVMKNKKVPRERNPFLLSGKRRWRLFHWIRAQTRRNGATNNLLSQCARPA